MELSEQQQAQITSTGISFMQAIVDIYGVDEGNKLWDTIADSVDPDIRRYIFMAMLTGHYGQVQLSGITPAGQNSYVECIKAYRVVTGAGLKEAKDACDRIKNNGSIEKIDCKPGDRHHVISKLNNWFYCR